MDTNIIWKILLVLQPFAGTFIVNMLGGNLSEKNRKWYNSLKQSPLTPPPIVFPIAWTILYLLIGLSAMFYLEHPTFLTQYFGPYEVQLTDIKSLILYQGNIYDKVIYIPPLTFYGQLSFSNYRSHLSHSS